MDERGARIRMHWLITINDLLENVLYTEFILMGYPMDWKAKF